MWPLVRLPGNFQVSCLNDAHSGSPHKPRISTTHRLPTVTLGSRWSRAALQKVRKSVKADNKWGEV